MRLVFIILLLVVNSIAFDIKLNNNVKNIDYEFINGEYVTSENYSFNDTSSILIKFNEETPSLINQFESEYNLRLEKVLIIGYYVYKIDSNIIETISNISKEQNINSVKPNWVKYKKKR